ncbi:MAG: ribonuclease P protein component [Deltaproteobacteria bacterium]|nr:ribonuclease P protein component [Deltaproteobacteria bacterium]
MAGGGAPTGRFRRSDRIVDSRDFSRVLRRGRRRAHRDLVVVTLARSEGRPGSQRSSGPVGRAGDDPSARTTVAGSRLGITASRKVGNAVRRNRFKRRVREWFRRRRLDLDPPVDLVVIARRSGAALEMAELDQRLSGLLELDAEGD